MFKHEKQLIHPVGDGRPNTQHASFLQEKLSGGNGERKTPVQYISQNLCVNNPKYKDLFLDIAAEKLKAYKNAGTDDQSFERPVKMYFSMFNPGCNAFTGNPVNLLTFTS